MQIKSYEGAVRYLEDFIGKVFFRVDPESIKEHHPLERMRILLSLLGNPQEKFRSVLVGGTSGKGSTAYLISHILITAGYKTGFTLSPHLQKINERLRVNGQSISNEEFVKLFKNSILPSIREMSQMRIGAPSYFEILIGMAFLYFADQKVDIAVVEVGMGGEFDATNTLNPLIAVLTNVGLDHTNILGKTVEKIARTKVGIIKSSRGPVAGFPPVTARSEFSFRKNSLRGVGSPSSRATPLVVISGVKQSSVIKIVEDKCKEAGAKLHRLGKDFNYKIKKENIERSIFDLISRRDRVRKLNDLYVSLLGDYQVENASIAIKTVLELEKLGFEVSNKAIRKALSVAFFPGRFEIVHIAQQPRVSDDARLHISKRQSINSASLSKSRLQPERQLTLNSSESGLFRSTNSQFSILNSQLILDGAHNPTKMKEFLKSLKKIFPKEKKVFIVGFKFDKDIPKMLKQIVKVADEIIITEFNRATDMSINASSDALNLKAQISKLKSDVRVIVQKDSKKALALALNYPITQLPNYPTIIVVTGSLYLVGEVRNML